MFICTPQSGILLAVELYDAYILALRFFPRLCLAVWSGFPVSLVVQGGMGLWSSFFRSPTRLQAYHGPTRPANCLYSACIAFWNCSRFLGSFALASSPLFFSIHPFRPRYLFFHAFALNFGSASGSLPLKVSPLFHCFSLHALFALVVVLCKLSDISNQRRRVERRVEPFLRRCLTHCAPIPDPAAALRRVLFRGYLPCVFWALCLAKKKDWLACHWFSLIFCRCLSNFSAAVLAFLGLESDAKPLRCLHNCVL